MRLMGRILILLLLGGLTLQRASADSVVTSLADLNWSAATFSGPVAPARSGYSILTDVQGFNITAPIYGTSENTLTSWGSSNSTVALTAGSYGQASAGTALNAFTADDGNYKFISETDIRGSIAAVNGSVTISIPYSFTVTDAGNCPSANSCYATEDQAWIDLWGVRGGGLTIDTASTELTGNYSTEGNLSISIPNATSSNYLFFAGVRSQTVLVPEPGTFSLFLFGLTGLGILITATKRSAAVRQQ